MRRSAFGPFVGFSFVVIVGASSTAVGQTPCPNAALLFDATTDVVRVAPHPSLDALTDFTFEGWANPGSGTSFLTIVGKANSSSTRTFHLGSDQITPTTWRPRLYLNHLVPGVMPLQLYASTTVPMGGWHHVAATRIGAAVTLYVDGAVVASATYGNPLGSNPSTPVLIGGDQIGTSFDGAVGDVRIWNVGRNAASISALASAVLTGVESGLVGYWPMDEGAGQVAGNYALVTGPALNGTLGASVAIGTDDPAWTTINAPPFAGYGCCGGCGCANSACATLTVNGAGATGTGPFPVSAPPGGALTFNWSGAPFQQFFLFSSYATVPAVSFGNICVDLDIVGLQTVFSPADPYFGPLFFLNAAGTAFQSFSVPATLAGASLIVQGLVLDAAGVCPANPGVMTTATFLIAF